jgi:hypothetical protein
MMLRISEQLFRDVMITAIAGGIDYWGRVTVAEGHLMKLDDPATPDVLDVAFCLVVEHEPSEGEVLKRKVLNRMVMQAGLDKLLSKGFEINHSILHRIIDGVRDDDAGHIDSEAADVLVQASMFGELVYS